MEQHVLPELLRKTVDELSILFKEVLVGNKVIKFTNAAGEMRRQLVHSHQHVSPLHAPVSCISLLPVLAGREIGSFLCPPG
jgi:hypothetical protein